MCPSTFAPAHCSHQPEIFRAPYPLSDAPSCHRFKIVQYINLIKSDDAAGSHGESFTSDQGGQFPWIPGEDFEYDYEAGHGTHTAGSAAGATLNNPAETVTCGTGRTLSCVGGCIDDDPYEVDDDLVTTFYASALDIDRLCPAFGCDPDFDDFCMSDDVSETLTKNGGMAQGAKLAIFDAFYGDFGLMDYAGNGLWEPCAEVDCKLHSNSWGADYECELSSMDARYDDFMYKVRFPAQIKNASPQTNHLFCPRLVFYFSEGQQNVIIPVLIQSPYLGTSTVLYRLKSSRPSSEVLTRSV